MQNLSFSSKNTTQDQLLMGLHGLNTVNVCSAEVEDPQNSSDKTYSLRINVLNNSDKKIDDLFKQAL